MSTTQPERPSRALTFEQARIFQRIEQGAQLKPVTWAQVVIRTHQTNEENFKRLGEITIKLVGNLNGIRAWVRAGKRSDDEKQVAEIYFRQTKAYLERCEGLRKYLSRRGK